MTEARPETGAAAPLPRWSLVFACLMHASALAWAAVALPLPARTAFVIGAFGLAAGHVLTALLAAARRAAVALLWRSLAFASLAFLACCAWQVIASAAYVATLYGGLGRGIAVVLAVALSPVALFTLPFALWGIAASGRREHPRRGGLALALLLLVGIAAAAGWHSVSRAAFEPLAAGGAPDRDALAAEIERHLPDWSELPAATGAAAAGLGAAGPVRCEHPLVGSDRLATVGVRYLGATSNGAETRIRCLQGEPDQLPAQLGGLLRADSLRGPVKIDWVIAARPLVAGPAPLAALELQPGLDGVCLASACLMPWQLVLGDHFTAMRPLAFVPDFRFGFDPAAVRAALGAPGDPGVPGLFAIRVVSLTLDRTGALQALTRLRTPAPALDGPALARAARQAEHHLVRSQRRSGGFDYLRNVSTGDVISENVSIPRQAGVTLVLCELGRDREGIARVAGRALAKLSHWERRSGNLSGLTRDPRGRLGGLGEAALPLIAFLECRSTVGPHFDALIGRLGRLLLALQREDGGFHPRFDFDRGVPAPGPAQLYADGQAVYALSLLERAASSDSDSAGLPAHAELRAAVERAMDFFANRYWDHPLGDAFFIEENWHCLAARASLEHHRNDEYERFCLDYTAFRSRFILDADSDVAPDFIGGFGFGNVFPPQTVPTAGFGETLAAAIAIKRARGEDVDDELSLLELVLRFLLRQQWSEASCFACARPERIVGGFSESLVSPTLRIDFTQHAWAAIGHGAQALGWRQSDGLEKLID